MTAPPGARTRGPRAARPARAVAAVLVTLLAAAPALGATGTVFTIAGNGAPGFAGDGGPSTGALVNHPRSIAFLPDGSTIFTDTDNARIRKISPRGTITTIAGTGAPGAAGDGGPATSAQLRFPTYLAVYPDGGYLIADEFNHRIRKVTAAGIISTVAGSGEAGFGGDGGPATAAQLDNPRGVAIVPGGGFLIADEQNNRIRFVDPAGVITTVAGTGTIGGAGDGGPATAAQFESPVSVLALSPTSFLVADRGNNRVRQVSDGVITTIAGTGVSGFSGDGGPATAAELRSPRDLAMGPDGSLYIADSLNGRVRRVQPGGIIDTVAGAGSGYAGDGGPARDARFLHPYGFGLRSDGDLVVGDTDNHRVRLVDIGGGDTSPSAPGPGGTTGGGSAAGNPPVATRLKVVSARFARRGARHTIRLVFTTPQRRTPVVLQRRAHGRWNTLRARRASGRTELLVVRFTQLGTTWLRVRYTSAGVGHVTPRFRVGVVRAAP